MSRAPNDTPTTASAEDGEVMLDGPGGLAVSLTPNAAEASAAAIAQAATIARGQMPRAKSCGD
ncbi:hypothetical protein [Sphingomonas sp. GB1N7]|uniref:hypothetical protein n=1 Tax=Parasphingomonas caseinilytica TaxID=3096158 RepID=UPI002FC8B087